ncbi:MAG: hypothetical protein AAGG75_25620 [Bacteroidota bacterium]
MSGPEKKTNTTNQGDNLRLTEQKLKGIEQKIDKALKAIKALQPRQEDESAD